jgi:hypothetical protein
MGMSGLFCYQIRGRDMLQLINDRAKLLNMPYKKDGAVNQLRAGEDGVTVNGMPFALEE